MHIILHALLLIYVS